LLGNPEVRYPISLYKMSTIRNPPRAMAKTESTAVNDLINLVSTATPRRPAPDEDLMFTDPSKRPAPSKQPSMPRMTATISGAGEVEPLPRGRGASGTQKNSVAIPAVRVSTAPPSRQTTIPPIGVAPARPSLPPPTRSNTLSPSARMAPPMGLPVVAPYEASAPVAAQGHAPVDLTDQSWFEESRAVKRVSGPVHEDTWVGTVQVPKGVTTKQLFGKLALPMGAMIAIGVFVGGYVAFDGEGGHKRNPQPALAAPAASAEPVAAAAEPVAVAAAAASTSSISSQSSLPCSTAPTHHRPVVSAASHTADRDSAMPSACHRNSTTPPSSTAAPSCCGTRTSRRSTSTRSRAT